MLLHRELYGVESLLLCFSEVVVMLNIFWIYSYNFWETYLLSILQGWHRSTGMDSFALSQLGQSATKTLPIPLLWSISLSLFASYLRVKNSQKNCLLLKGSIEPRFLSFYLCTLCSSEVQRRARSQHLSAEFQWVTPSQLSTVWRIWTRTTTYPEVYKFSKEKNIYSLRVT